MDNRRKYPRFVARVPLYVHVGPGFVQKWIEIETRDVSEGGLCFLTGTRLPLRAHARILVGRLGGSLPETALIKGQVAHLDQDPDSGRYRVGVEFHELVDVTPEQLKARIEEWTSSLPR